MTIQSNLISSALSLLLLLVAIVGSDISLDTFTPDASADEMVNNVKVFLSDIKIRRVPLAKRRAEKALDDLYAEKRALDEEFKGLEKKLARLSPIGKGFIQMSTESVVSNTIYQTTQANIAKWEASFKEKEYRLKEIKEEIEEANRIARHPHTYVSVPVHYGRDPVAEQERERDLLIQDRENMLYRGKIVTGEIKPLWLVDEW